MWMGEVSLSPYGGLPKAFAVATVEMEVDFSLSAKMRSKLAATACKEHLPISKITQGPYDDVSGLPEDDGPGCLSSEAIAILQSF